MTLAVQSLTAMALAVPPVLAPVAAADFGAAPTAVGQWVGFSYTVAMFAGLASGTLVGRHGPVRVLQVAVLGVALGLAVVAVALTLRLHFRARAQLRAEPALLAASGLRA